MTSLLILCLGAGYVSGSLLAHRGVSLRHKHSHMGESQRLIINRRLEAIRQAMAKNQKEYDFVIASPAHLR